MSETGIVKFSCEHRRAPLPHFAGFEELNATRRKLLQRRLLGVDASGIGFGNLSVRSGLTNQFYITGSGTGHLARLELEHIAQVTDWDFARNWLRCEGATVASSESLTHAAIYQTDAPTSAILHGHSDAMWHRLRGHAPTTRAEIEYGTPAMAGEVARLLGESEARSGDVIVMGGHEGGLLFLGASLEEAFARITEILL